MDQMTLHRTALFLLMLITACVYCPTLDGEFLVDDTMMIASPFEIRSISDLWLSLKGGVDFDPSDGATPRIVGTMYKHRPVSMTVRLLMKTAFGTNPIPYHVVSLLLHLFCVGLAYRILRPHLKEVSSLMLGLALFALHPFQTDSVAWINGIPDPLMFCFIGLTLLLARGIKQPLLLGSGTFVLLLLAIGCKEPGLMVLPLLFPWCAGGESKRKQLLAVALAAAAALVVIGMFRYMALQGVGEKADIQFSWGVLLQVPAFSLETMVKFASLFNIPWMMRYRLIDYRVASYAVGVVALFGLGWLYWRVLRQGDRSWRWYFLLLVSFLVPVTYIHAITYASPRMYYVPLFAFGGMLALLSDRWCGGVRHRRTIVTMVVSLLVCLLATSTLVRGKAYQSQLTFWQAEIDHNPSNAYGYYYYATRLMRLHRFVEALPLVEKAHEMEPEAIQVMNNLGICYLNLQRLDEAERLFRSILARKPEHCKSYPHLALVERRRGDLEGAMGHLKRAPAICNSYQPSQRLLAELAAQLESSSAKGGSGLR